MEPDTDMKYKKKFVLRSHTARRGSRWHFIARYATEESASAAVSGWFEKHDGLTCFSIHLSGPGVDRHWQHPDFDD